MYKLKTLETGFFLADGGAMFGAVPKRAWSKKYPADENNLCRLSMRCVLAISDTRKVVIDTGIKHENIKKFSYYGFHDVKQIDECIAEFGLKVEDITDVVLTHFHFDHCGASTRQGQNGQWKPMFPNAQYWASRKQWDVAHNPGPLEMDSFFKEDFEPMYDAGQITLINDSYAIDSDFRLKIFDGHTPGQVACYIDGENSNYLVPGDVIPTAVNVPLRWVSAYDINAEASVKSKMEMLEDAVREDRELIFFHDVYTKSAKVAKSGDMFMVKKI